ncbi:MAG: helix-turn-helix transcriptional regulator [Elainellaceae cyanobacterium]
MTVILSQPDYWAVFQESEQKAAQLCQPAQRNLEEMNNVHPFPKRLGHGQYQEFDLRGDIELAIADYCLHDDLIIQLPEREHCLEYSFFLPEEEGDRDSSYMAGEYVLYGSGTALQERHHLPGCRRIRSLNVHIAPEQLYSFLAVSDGSLPDTLQHLVRNSSDPYYIRSGTTTPAMQMVVHQLLSCPFREMTQRMYLESKIWELMTLLIEQEQTVHHESNSLSGLKPDDIDRIHQAKEILMNQIDQPPSLLDLARQVGLNDCTLKRGFRQVFGTTAFGYLHDYRLEQARQLLQSRHLNVSEVARAIGFANRSYFAAAFRKKFGVSPKHYLVQHKNSV